MSEQLASLLREAADCISERGWCEHALALIQVPPMDVPMNQFDPLVNRLRDAAEALSPEKEANQ